jgi:uncharacterized protein (TIGR03118 family)
LTEETTMKLWQYPWQRSAAKKSSSAWKRRAILALEHLEDRCVMSASGFTQVNLASDLPGLANVTVPSLVNPWGMSFSPTGPFWFADAGAGVSNLLDGRGQSVPLIVTVPGTGGAAAQPTGTVVNTSQGFAVSANGHTAPSTFLFASIDGTISGWTEGVDFNHAILAVDNSSQHAVYTGLTLATNRSGQSFLYAADVSLGRIDVFDEHFNPVVRPGAFQDPNLPAWYSPINIQNLGGKLYVEYVGPVGGFVDVYSTDGTLVSRFASQGTLNAPWGVTLAPADFGQFGGAILVGNNGDGRINAFAPTTGAFLGQLSDDTGAPIVIPDLWALNFGNGHLGGNSHMLFFTAGIDDVHGLFGAIQPPQLRGADTAGDGRFDPDAPGEPENYPLPPVQGPTLQDPSTTGRPVSVLMPMNASSLALAPTLAVAPQQAPPAQASSNHVMVASLESSSATVARFIAQEAADATSGQGNPITLNSFLDLNPATTGTVEPTARPRVFREVDQARTSPSVRNDPSLFAEIVVSEGRPNQTEEPAVPVAPSVASSPSFVHEVEAADVNGQGSGWTRVLGGLLGVIAIHIAAGNLRGGVGRRKTDLAHASPALHGDKTSSGGFEAA